MGRRGGICRPLITSENVAGHDERETWINICCGAALELAHEKGSGRVTFLPSSRTIRHGMDNGEEKMGKCVTIRPRKSFLMKIQLNFHLLYSVTMWTRLKPPPFSLRSSARFLCEIKIWFSWWCRKRFSRFDSGAFLLSQKTNEGREEKFLLIERREKEQEAVLCLRTLLCGLHVFGVAHAMWMRGWDEASWFNGNWKFSLLKFYLRLTLSSTRRKQSLVG